METVCMIFIVLCTFSWRDTQNHFRLINITIGLISLDEYEDTCMCCVTVCGGHSAHCLDGEARLCCVIYCECSQSLADVNAWREAVLKHRDFPVCLFMLFLTKEITYPKSSFTEKQYCADGLPVVHTPGSLCLESGGVFSRTFRSALSVEGRILSDWAITAPFMVRESTTSVWSSRAGYVLFRATFSFNLFHVPLWTHYNVSWVQNHIRNKMYLSLRAYRYMVLVGQTVCSDCCSTESALCSSAVVQYSKRKMYYYHLVARILHSLWQPRKIIVTKQWDIQYLWIT